MFSDRGGMSAVIDAPGTYNEEGDEARNRIKTSVVVHT